MRVWVTYSIYVRETSDPSLGFLDPCLSHHYIHFMWLISMLWCRLTITHFPIFLFSSIFVILLHFVLPHLISFFSHPTWCLTWVQHSHFTLAYLICHSFIIIFHVGILRSTTHDVFYALHLMHEGYGDYIIGIIELSFLLFLSPHYLSVRYVPSLKTTLRP